MGDASHVECVSAPPVAFTYSVREDASRSTVAYKATSSKRQKVHQKHSPAEQKAKRKHVQRSVTKVKPMTQSNWKTKLAKKVVAGVASAAIALFSNTDLTNSAP
ncbi:hypothetical protein [Burkholderia vietnamiensis]|uniref:hypothetical protein n=1 Tax=Burkholderia vietnamiensis TaxID=60552 RepID=UPI00158C1BAE|nr:hypothetical protein [Burkholderia vietnamiensis]